MIRPAPMIACDVGMKFDSSTEMVVPSTPSAANARPKNRMFSGVGVQRFSAGASAFGSARIGGSRKAIGIAIKLNMP